MEWTLLPSKGNKNHHHERKLDVGMDKGGSGRICDSEYNEQYSVKVIHDAFVPKNCYE